MAAGGSKFYFSSGAQTSNSHGVAWLRQGSDLLCILSMENERWYVTAPMQDSIWYHFVTTWSHKQGVRLYKDGVSVDMNSFPSGSPYNPNCCDNVVIGADNSAQGHGEVWIDDIISYEHIVDENYVKDLYLSYFY